MSSQDASHDFAPVSLLSVQPGDVSALVEAHTAAFKTDQFSSLMLLNRDENAHQDLMSKSIQRWMSDPAAKLTKAVSATGQLVGWSCWIVKTSDAAEPAADQKSVPDSNPDKTTALEVKSDSSEIQKKLEQSAPQDPIRVLGGLMHKDMTSWEGKYLRGKKYMVLQALATDPRYQRQGIATKLVQQGIEEVDSSGLPCWIHASPTSYRLYEKSGFEEVGRSDYDLDGWAPGEKSGNQDWGRYTFRYMLRSARGTA